MPWWQAPGAPAAAPKHAPWAPIPGCIPGADAAAGSSGQQPEEGVDVGHRDMAAALGSSRGEGRHHHHHKHHPNTGMGNGNGGGEGWISSKEAFRSGVTRHKR
jgi:hypothetical protein